MTFSPQASVEGRVAARPDFDGYSGYSVSSSASFANHSREGNMQDARRDFARNFTSKDTRNIPAFSITQGDWLKLVSTAFREDSPHPGAAKALAQSLECSEKTIQSWLDGKTAPSGILDLRAMSRVPAYAALKREVAALESDLDPRIQAKLHELHALTIALGGCK